jgi:hypothetical protein
MTSSEEVCLICSKRISKKKNKSSSPPYYNKQNLRKSVLLKIFEYLLFPQKHIPELYELCRSEGFCRACDTGIQEVFRIQQKIIAMELTIQNKVESLGRIMVAACNNGKRDLRSDSRLDKELSTKSQEIWDKLRKPVIQRKIPYCKIRTKMNLRLIPIDC